MAFVQNKFIFHMDSKQNSASNLVSLTSTRDTTTQHTPHHQHKQERTVAPPTSKPPNPFAITYVPTSSQANSAILPPALISMRNNLTDTLFSQSVQRDQRPTGATISKMNERGLERKMTQAARVGKQTGRWLKIEHYRFLKALQIYGRDWKRVEQFVESRTGAQIRSHAQKFFTRIEKEYRASDAMSFIQNMHVPDLESLEFKNEAITDQEMMIMDNRDSSQSNYSAKNEIMGDIPSEVQDYSSSNLKPRAFSSTCLDFTDSAETPVLKRELQPLDSVPSFMEAGLSFPKSRDVQICEVMKNYSIVKLEIALKMFSSSITSELRNDARRLANIKEEFQRLKVDPNVINEVRKTLNLLEDQILRVTAPETLRQSGWSERARTYFEQYLGETFSGSNFALFYEKYEEYLRSKRSVSPEQKTSNSNHETYTIKPKSEPFEYQVNMKPSMTRKLPKHSLVLQKTLRRSNSNFELHNENAQKSIERLRASLGPNRVILTESSHSSSHYSVKEQDSVSNNSELKA